MNSYSRGSYPLFNELPQSLNVLYTMVLIILGMGYIFAMIQIYEVHSGRDGKAGLSVDDIRIAYRGNHAASRLESALRGPMAGNLSPAEAETVIAWVKAGASEDGYAKDVEPIVKERCAMCHDGSNPSLPKLVSYDGLKNVAAVDTGESIGTLVRVSHIHLFGLTFIFAFMGLIFSHSYVRKMYIKSIITAIPFVAIILDIMSWWLTKVSGGFAYVVFVGGILMGVSFLYQWVISIYQIWFFKCPDDEVCIP